MATPRRHRRCWRKKSINLDTGSNGIAAKKEAALYRQRGALAYLNDTQAALRDYTKAAELDPDDGEGLIFLGQLQARAGDSPAAKQSFERVIALGDRPENEKQRHWAYFLLGDIDAALGDRKAALDHYKRAQSLVQELAARDPNNAEWQRDLSVSYDRVGDISAARGDRDGALLDYQAAFDTSKKLTEKDPNNTLWQEDLARYYYRVGDISAARGDRDGALKAYKDGLDIAKAARRPRSPTTPNGSAISPSAIDQSRRHQQPPEATATAALKAYQATAWRLRRSSPHATQTTPNGSAISP